MSGPITKTVHTAALAFVLAGLPMPAPAEPSTCSYTTYKWNVVQRKAVEYRRVSHPYDRVTDIERDEATGCTVCEQDQVDIALPGIKSFKMCRQLAGPVEVALGELLAQGQPIYKVIAYRVGMTRGDIDAGGNRTRFSNHSFGIALDINDEQNGLYDHCIRFGPQCRLIQGGRWSPSRAGSWTADSQVVHSMQSLGFKWGGQIEGKQKDFMHFSPTGY